MRKFLLMFLFTVTINSVYCADTTDVKTKYLNKDTLVIKTVDSTKKSDDTFLHTILGVIVGGLFTLLGTSYTIRNQRKHQNIQMLINSKQNWLNQLKDNYAEYSKSIFKYMSAIEDIMRQKLADSEKETMLLQNIQTQIRLLLTNIKTRDISLSFELVNFTLTQMHLCALQTNKDNLKQEMKNFATDALTDYTESMILENNDPKYKEEIKKSLEDLVDDKNNPKIVHSEKMDKLKNLLNFDLLPNLDAKMAEFFLNTNKEIDSLLEDKPNIFVRIKQSIDKWYESYQ